ncbi:uncharacterized protein LOC135484886 [Lineus longissimus]|uniref:uncharacterized protein LOC135484886 n=1 Tax=Lineus longissimus TaxID=88925 RepID=UPI00315D8027
MNVLLGCPPNLDLMFDIQASLSAVEHSDLGEFPWDCLVVDPDFPCFYFGNGKNQLVGNTRVGHTILLLTLIFYPFFRVIDRASGNTWRFEGNYTLKIVGGRIVQDEFYEQYTEEQVLHFNQHNFQLHQTLIWNPYNETFINDNGWFIYSHLNNAITWTCLSNSPCAYVFPRQFGDAPEYYFELEVSNIGVDSSTFCAFKKRFKVHIHGLAMNMTTMPLYIVGGTTAIFMLFIFVYWLFHCQNDRLINGIKETCRAAFRIRFKRKVEPVKVPGYLSQLSLAVDSDDILGQGAFPETLSDLKKSTQRWEQRRLSKRRESDLPPVSDGSSDSMGPKEGLPLIKGSFGSMDQRGSLPLMKGSFDSMDQRGSLPLMKGSFGTMGRKGSLPPIRDRSGSTGQDLESNLRRIQEETASRYHFTEETNNNNEGKNMRTEL